MNVANTKPAVHVTEMGLEESRGGKKNANLKETKLANCTANSQKHRERDPKRFKSNKIPFRNKMGVRCISRVIFIPVVHLCVIESCNLLNVGLS